MDESDLVNICRDGSWPGKGRVNGATMKGLVRAGGELDISRLWTHRGHPGKELVSKAGSVWGTLGTGGAGPQRIMDCTCSAGAGAWRRGDTRLQTWGGNQTPPGTRKAGSASQSRDSQVTDT